MISDTITIFINGEPLLGYTSFQGRITQQLNEHHFFEVSFSSFIDTSIATTPFQDHDKYQNQEISVFSANGKLQFKGIILSVEHTHGSEGKQRGITFTGKSPTYLLQETTQCQSFDQGSSFQDIISTVTEGYPTNLIDTQYGRETDLQLGYTVQYNESDWHFIQRMSKRYGVYTYYNGSQLNIGRNTEAVQQWQGTLGVDIKQFRVIDNLENHSFGVAYKDCTVDEALSAQTTQVSTNVPNTLTPTMNRSTEAFAKEGSFYYPYLQDEHSGQQMLDYMTKVQAQGKLSRMITATGTTKILGLSLCDQIEVIGHSYTNALSDQPYGIYELTKITHVFTNQGHYHNEIEAVIRGLEHPPYSNIYATPKIEAMSATVMDNNDTQGLNRLKLQFPWQVSTNSTTSWVRCINTHAGTTHGSYIVAETGDEVWCTFQGDNPECPVVIGATYNQSAPSPFHDPDNNKKVIYSRSGNIVLLNDEDSSITVKNNSGSTMILQSNGNALIHAPNNLVLDAKNIVMKASNSIEILSAPNQDGEGEGIIQVKAQKEIIAEAIDEMVALKSKLDLLLESTDAKVGLTSKEDTTIDSDSAVQITAKDTFHAHGSDMGLLTGGKVKVNKA
ncbi:contractile injection system protein, VgrG/Pvc8 family [Aquimarina sp. I32.4]|uniref:contractile injection system protein, VgrG/Pvc8 family n=1 Tax=Aquimarina sp. I32.4 TaxID=2053903 RepID=UPI000CDE858D|nr:contractile injection system protein, VgrG/Pvc8 family [Aquimarina sp. I32.4]